MRVEFFSGVLALLMLSGAAAAQSPTPECGRISQFDVAPRNRQVYPVRILAINGRLPGPTSSDVYRVGPGTHVVKVAEQIDSRQFQSIELRRRTVNRVARAEITFEVEAGYTYFVGAQSFLHGDRDAIAVRHGREYWAPVVYQRVAENCR